MNDDPQPAFGRWDWLAPIYLGLQLALIVVIYRRSRRRQGRSLWSPFTTRADLMAGLKAEVAVAVINRLVERFVPQVPTGRKPSPPLDRRAPERRP